MPAEARVTEAPALATLPADTNELLLLVEAALLTSLGTQPTVDDDGDFVLTHLGQTLWVRVLTVQPAVQIRACVVRDVRSPRTTLVELAVLNRDHPWVKWTLVDREVWQVILLPGLPFVPRHLDELLTVFRSTLARTRDDLVLRTGGRLG